VKVGRRLSGLIREGSRLYWQRAEPLGAADSAQPGARRDRIGKLIRKLGDDNDNTVVQTARALVSELQAHGADLHVLAVLWSAEESRRAGPRPTRPPPIDWPAVEAAIARYANGKTTLTMNKVLSQNGGACNRSGPARTRAPRSYEPGQQLYRPHA
jgi:hypothetical protein